MPIARMALKSNVAAPPGLLPLCALEKDSGRPDMDTLPVHIAILDDDQSVRTAIARLLKTSHINTVSFASYIALLDFLQHDELDCLLLDLQMPGMSGLDVMHYLDQRNIKLPVVVITAHDGPGAREACLTAGAAAYMRKPLDYDALMDAITLAINGGRQEL